MVRRQEAALRCAAGRRAPEGASLNRRGWLGASAAAALTLAVGLFATREAPRAHAPIRQTVDALTSAELEGRAFATPGEARAAEYIADAFDRLRLPPPPGAQRFQPVETVVDGERRVASRGNVLAWLEGDGAKTVVVSAHHDHLGHGGPLSREPLRDVVHPGADDNASGVALLLAVADALATRGTRLPVNVLFVSTAGEEPGLFGARVFADTPPVPLSSIRCFVNLDMVGRLDRSSPVLAVEGTREWPALAPLVAQVAPRGFAVRTEVDLFPGGSDYQVLHERGVPVLALSSGLTADYHRSSDRPDTLNYEGLEALTGYVVDLVEVLATR